MHLATEERKQTRGRNYSEMKRVYLARLLLESVREGPQPRHAPSFQRKPESSWLQNHGCPTAPASGLQNHVEILKSGI